MASETVYCPTCDDFTNVLRDKPWLGEVCLRCGTTISNGTTR